MNSGEHLISIRLIPATGALALGLLLRLAR
ncbi:hypothetical protein DSM104443_01330 [Usitatibacter rugosus]|uniref:Uncharacterized protein n=1 Tax=Usitatibacter rugosus TaxID=2732067 RepID=A0A6M4GT44_9PROT|nr:hypothetical protein DSM104443_01330 [Usitatibacter rugosus]